MSVYYVEEGARRVRPTIDLALTVEPGGTLRNADGKPVADARALGDVLVRHAGALPAGSPIVVDLYTDGAEAERHVGMEGLARAVDLVQTAAALAGPQVPSRLTIHVHSALLTEARLARGH